MPVLSDKPYNAQLVRPDDPEYVAFMRRMADRSPSRGGPRAAGEWLGGLVEQCARLCLAQHVTLIDTRILQWEQRQKNGRHTTLYRELDAVSEPAPGELCIFEIKLTTPENMERGHGIRQLNAASDTMLTAGAAERVSRRLVYIAEEPFDVLDGLPVVTPDQFDEELGVVWISPSRIEDAAGILSLDLPPDWLLPESREGVMEDPEREEWRQFADAAPAESGNSLADALRRAMGGQP